MSITSLPIETISYNGVNIQLVSGEYDIVDISTTSAMDALLVAANVGKTYRFTGTTTATYINGDLYEVESV